MQNVLDHEPFPPILVVNGGRLRMEAHPVIANAEPPRCRRGIHESTYVPMLGLGVLLNRASNSVNRCAVEMSKVT